MSQLSAAERDAWRASVAAVVARCAAGGSWDALFDLGVAEIGLEDLAVAIEECGAVPVATPLLGHMFGLRALHAAPASPERDRLLAGRQRLALVLPGGWVLEGGAADWFVVAAGTGLSVVPAGRADRRPLSTLEPSRVLWRVEFDGSAATRLGDWHEERLRAELAALVAADSIGGARAVLRDVVAYARQRMQFGRPIGSFQAVKHRLADVSSQLDGAVAAVEYALRRLDLGAPDATPAASVAKLAAVDAYLAVAEGAIQTYGGIGFTWEHPAHIFLKRAHTNSQLVGGAASHLELVAGLAGI
ncbi:acyl-CoA dehydrogenase family protein [Dactylosporangium sp. CA-052675]|uniref:acyl-CoA dehydrogenase family protein n=1 Tax=Dactylosporangium sp. CA-052675 TaxID=3239927 RepID=UPI003D907028